MSLTLVGLIVVVAGVGLLRIRALRVRALEHIDEFFGRLKAKLGPMTPEQFLKQTVRALKRSATKMHSEVVFPNVIEVGINPADFDSWGPLIERLTQELITVMRELAVDLEFAVFGEPAITLKREPGVRSHRPRYRMRLQQPKAPVRTGREPDESATPSMRRPALRSMGRPTTHSPAGTVTPLHRLTALPTRRLVVLRADIDGRPVLEFQCGEGAHVGGRNKRCELRIEHPSVSNVHFELIVSRDGATVQDLGSTNGTVLRDGGPAPTPVLLRDGAVVQLSHEVSIHVVCGAEARKAA